ncbi:MAG: 50S ribosomal protein L15 [Myxococcota bacterium]|nr:50S ribosomal protein L15 [Myxococcota bacterium]
MADETPKAEVPILSRLRAPVGAVTKKLRVGRGPGSGLGKTAGRGQKGQKARQPGNIHKLHFEGGQMPLNRRLPKVGFNALFPTVYAEINVARLEEFEAGSTVNQAVLRERGFVKGQVDGLKILGNGELTKKLVVEAEAFSASAKEKIEKAGGTATLLEKKVAPVVRHKNKPAKPPKGAKA